MCVCVRARDGGVGSRISSWNGPRDHALHIYVSDARILRLEMREPTHAHLDATSPRTETDNYVHIAHTFTHTAKKMAVDKIWINVFKYDLLTKTI